MKNYIKYLFVAIAAFVFASCEQDPELLGTKVEVNLTSLNFTAQSAAEQSIAVSAQGQWIVVSPDWITVTPNSGENNANVTVSVSDNLDTDGTLAAERSGIITIAVGNQSGQYSDITVLQAGDPNKKPAEIEKITVAEFNAAPESSSVFYELTGSISGITNTYYGNFYISDETGSVYVYGLYDEPGGSYGAFEDLGLSEGDIITLRGTRGSYNDLIEVMNGYYVSHTPSLVSVKPQEVEMPIEGGNFTIALVYKGDTFEVGIPEEVNSWLSMGTIYPDGDTTRISFNVVENPGQPRSADIEFTSASIDGTASSTVTIPVSQDGAIVTLDASIAEFLAAEEGVEGTYYRLQGEVVSIANETYGNFTIKDASGEVYVYGCLTEQGGESRQFASLGIKVGDIITIVGSRASYKGTPQVGGAYYESHYSPVVATVAEFLAAEVSNDVWYKLTGAISQIASTTYGNFNIVDETGSVYVYGLLTGLNGENKQFASLNLAEGDNITLIGRRAEYKGTPQVGAAWFVSKNSTTTTVAE